MRKSNKNLLLLPLWFIISWSIALEGMDNNQQNSTDITLIEELKKSLSQGKKKSELLDNKDPIDYTMDEEGNIIALKINNHKLESALNPLLGSPLKSINQNYIQNFKYLEILDLSSNQINDPGDFEPLSNKKLPLTQLNLSNNNIGDIGALSMLLGLKWLNLQNNKISIERLQVLQKNLPDCVLITDYPDLNEKFELSWLSQTSDSTIFENIKNYIVILLPFSRHDKFELY